MCVCDAEGREGDILSCIAAINVNASNCRRGGVRAVRLRTSYTLTHTRRVCTVRVARVHVCTTTWVRFACLRSARRYSFPPPFTRRAVLLSLPAERGGGKWGVKNTVGAKPSSSHVERPAEGKGDRTINFDVARIIGLFCSHSNRASLFYGSAKEAIKTDSGQISPLLFSFTFFFGGTKSRFYENFFPVSSAV